MKKIVCLALLFSLVVFIRLALADSLYLKDGTRLDGTVLEETPEWVLFEVYGGKVKFSHSEISRIERNSLTSTPAPKPVSVPSAPQAPEAKNIPLPAKRLSAERVTVPSAQSRLKSEYMSRVQGMYDGVKEELARLEVAKEAESKPAQGFKVQNALGSIGKISSFIPSNLTGEGWDRVRTHLDHFTNPKPISPADLKDTDKFLKWFGNTLVVLFFSAFVIFAYIWILRGQVTYWRALWFLIKFNIVTNILFMVSSKALVPNPGATPAFFEPGGPGLFLLLGFIVLTIFYWFAKMDFDSGVFKTTGLLILVVLASVFSGCAAAYFGLV